MKEKGIVLFIFWFSLISSCWSQDLNYVMPEENAEHEATWLQWPHGYTYGNFYRNSLDQTWVDLTNALIESEKVYIVAYNQTEKNRIINLLNAASVSLDQITFFIHQNDDVWIRDNGPIFVYDENDQLTILDWDFNGWGNDTPYNKCNVIPELISTDLTLPRIDLSEMVLEGGAVESDGKGTMMATRSSVTHASRNPNLSEAEIEAYLTTYMGFTKFIWLDGLYGEEITDMHIDGFVKFADENVILTMNQADLLYWGVSQPDIDLIYFATNKDDIPYEIAFLPLTTNNVSTEYGTDLGYKGSYANYYIANSVVLVPNYNDPADAIANSIIQSYYSDRIVVGIDVRNLYENGGMVHCVTQQQPVVLESNQLGKLEKMDAFDFQISPNPAQSEAKIVVSISEGNSLDYEIYNCAGKLLFEEDNIMLLEGKNEIRVDLKSLEAGVYFMSISVDGELKMKKFVVE
jgi:agmatine deiminase